MDIMDVASKGIRKITSAYGKKLRRETVLQTIDRNPPRLIEGDTFRVGFARADIMPDLTADKTYWIAGHGSGHKMEGILSPVFIHAVWIDCGADEGILWLSADIIGLTTVEVNRIRSRIRASAIIKGARSINISCTHSHSGIDTVGYWGKPNAVSIPSDGKDPAYMEMLFSRAVQVSESAFLARRPGRFFAGRAAIPNGLFSKRKFADRHEVLSRLRFVPDDGGEETWLLNLGAHPNSLGGDNRLLSGEYPYYMRQKIQAQCGANVHFGIGAIGGMDAAQFEGEEDRVQWIKNQAALYAEAAMGITEETQLQPRVKFLRRQFYIPVDNNVLALLAIRGTMSFQGFPCETAATGIATKSEMTLLELGAQKILFLPGESFVSTVYGGYEPKETSSTGMGPEVNPAPLCEIAGDDTMIAYGITNDMTGYVVPVNDFVLHPTQPYLNATRDRFGDNHYHETNSMGPQTQGVIADTFREVVEDFYA